MPHCCSCIGLLLLLLFLNIVDVNVVIMYFIRIYSRLYLLALCHFTLAMFIFRSDSSLCISCAWVQMKEAVKLQYLLDVLRNAGRLPAARS